MTVAKENSKPAPRQEIFDEIIGTLKERIMILDGAMGTMIQKHQLEEEDFRGEEFKSHTKNLKGDNDLLVLTRPEIILNIHRVGYYLFIKNIIFDKFLIFILKLALKKG